MEVIVHGTKQGYKSNFISNTTPSFSMGDIRSGVNSEYPLGEFVYSLAYRNNGCVYTKYIIVRDTLRSYATGFIAFSLFLSRYKTLRMKGKVIKSLLDKLSERYKEDYIRDNNLNRSEPNLIQENWDFVNEILTDYDCDEQNIYSEEENLQPGTSDPAFIYYPYNYRDPNSGKEREFNIEDIFDNPFQEEYRPYRQVFFVTSNFKKDEDKLKNPLNVLRHDQNADLTGKIDLENLPYKLREFDGQGKNGVSIEIRINGKLLHNKNAIRKKDNVTIKYFKNRYFKEIIEEGKLTDPKIAKYLKIDPNTGKIDVEKSVYLLPVEKAIRIEINGINENSKRDVEITYKKTHTNDTPQIAGNSITFSGEELKEEWTVRGESGDLSGESTFIPENRENIVLTLKEHKIFIIEERHEAVKYQESAPTTSKIMWVSRKENQPKVIAGLAVGLIIIGIFLALWLNNDRPTSITPETISEYVEGDSLFAEKLDTINAEWQKQEQKIKRSSDGILGILLGKTNRKPDSTAFNEWKETDESIDRAIEKRKLIDDKNFAELRSVGFSEKQLSLKLAIVKIDSTEYDTISQQLGDVSKLTLTQIADSINAIEKYLLKDKSFTAPTQQQSQPQPVITNKPVATPETPKTSSVSKTPSVPTTSPAPVSENNSDIIKYLKSSDLKRGKLKDYKDETTDTKLKKSINLALKFWDLDGKENGGYFSYNKELDNDDYLKGSELKKIVNRIVEKCNRDESLTPKYAKEIPGGNTTKSLRQLENDLIKSQ